MQSRVVVTGGTGNVGIHIVKCLLRAGYHVHVLTRSQPAREHPLCAENVTLTVMDLLALPEQEILDWLNIVRPLALVQPRLTSELQASSWRPLNASLCIDKITADAGVHPISLEEGLDSIRFLREGE
jgi:GDP-D-mannose dehydratase